MIRLQGNTGRFVTVFVDSHAGHKRTPWKATYESSMGITTPQHHGKAVQTLRLSSQFRRHVSVSKSRLVTGRKAILYPPTAVSGMSPFCVQVWLRPLAKAGIEQRRLVHHHKHPLIQRNTVSILTTIKAGVLFLMELLWK
jgi:hypothetical protein